MSATWLVVLVVAAGALAGGLTLYFLRCKIFGCAERHVGRRLASTTFYDHSQDPYLDQGEDSACGCNVKRDGAATLATWYNAAVNDALFGVDSTRTSKWNCGHGCGKCYRLTTTGRRSDNPQWSNRPLPGKSFHVVTTNFCPAADQRNRDWCAPLGRSVGPGSRKYQYHFDLQRTQELNDSWPGCNGDPCNAEVTFEEIACPKEVTEAFARNCRGGKVNCER